MSKLSIKRNRAAVKRILSDYKLRHIILSPREAKPRPAPKRENFHADDQVQAQVQPRIPSNADVFAARGDTWGALQPMAHPRELKVTVQPDGFVHVRFRRTPDEDEYVPLQAHTRWRLGR